MVDSAANPVDGPTKLEQRKAADQDDRNTNEGDGERDRDLNPDIYDNLSHRQARNIRDYHQGEITRLTRAIEQHQAIVDAQDEILSHPSSRRDDEPLENGTDIGDLFDKAGNAPDADPEANATEDAEQGSTEGKDETAEGNRSLSGTSGLTTEDNVQSSTEDDKSNPTPTDTPTPRPPNRKGK